MAQVTLAGTWVAPDLTPRTGKVIATLDDPTRIASIVGSAVGVLDVTGSLPATGVGSLQIAAPTSGTASYTIRERFTGVTEQTYRIAVAPDDTVIDLSTRPT